MNKRAVSEFLRTSQTFLYERLNRMQAQQQESIAKDTLKPLVLDQGTEDDSGHKHLLFDEPLHVGGKTYTGLTARKTVTPHLKVDEVWLWLEDNKLLDEIMVEIPARREPDWELVYVLNQEGKIPDEVVDSWQEDKVTWALWPKED